MKLAAIIMFALCIAFAINYAMSWSICWALSAGFGVTVPVWPVCVLLFVGGTVLKQIFGGGKS